MAYRLWCGGLPAWLVHEDVKLWAFGNSGVWPGNVQLVRKWHGETKISAILGYHKQQEAKDILERLSGVNCQGFRVTLKVSKDSEEKMKAHVNAKKPEEEEEKTKSGVAQAVVANEAGNSQERQEQPNSQWLYLQLQAHIQSKKLQRLHRQNLELWKLPSSKKFQCLHLQNLQLWKLPNSKKFQCLHLQKLQLWKLPNSKKLTSRTSKCGN